MIYMSLKMPNAGKTAIFNLGGQRLSTPQKLSHSRRCSKCLYML